MTWFKVDDRFWSHPKAIRAGNSACGVWVRGGSWASSYATDGVIPDDLARSISRKRDRDVLVEVGLWEVVEGGYLMHDFDEYNPSSDQVRADREAAAERQRRHRERMRDRTLSRTESQRSSRVTPTMAVTRDKRDPVPTRPVEEGEVLRTSPPNGQLGLVEVPSATRSPRAANPIFDALVAACGWTYDDMPTRQRRATGVAASELTTIGATPDEIARRAVAYRRKFKTTLTPNALVNQWAGLASAEPVDDGSRVINGVSYSADAIRRMQ